jgi:hypothetical protein
VATQSWRTRISIRQTGLACLLVLAIGSDAAGAVTLRVGTPAYPTIQAAIDAVPEVRARHPRGEAIEIVLPAGTLRLTSPISIDAKHGGSADAPLILRGAPGMGTRLLGSVMVPARPATATDMLGHAVPNGAVALDLRRLSITPNLDRRGAYVRNLAVGLILFQGARRLQPSAWPATGFQRIASLGSGPSAPRAAVPRAVVAGWAREPADWAAGYFSADWAYERTPVRRIDAAAGTLELAPMQSNLAIRPTVRLAIQNLFSQLRAPGSFAVDPGRALAVVVPQKGVPARFEVAVTPTLLNIRGARNVTVRDIAFDRAREDAVMVDAGHDIRFVDCAARQTGAGGVAVTGGTNVTFDRTVVTQIAERGVAMFGGDRATLTPSEHAFRKGIVMDFGTDSPSYRPAIALFGVGNSVVDSLIEGGRHAAIILSGNDHRVEGNEITGVLRDTEDAGAIYMGASWTQWGMVIRGNYVHGMGDPARPAQLLSAIYLDDQFGGALVEGNVLEGGVIGVVIGGGRNNRVIGNLILNPRRGAVHIDARGTGNQRGRLEAFRAELLGSPFQGPIWRRRFPLLAATPAPEYGVPRGNVIDGNLVFGAPLAVGTPQQATAYLELRGNMSRPAAVFDVAERRRLVRSRAMPALADRTELRRALGSRLVIPGE